MGTQRQDFAEFYLSFRDDCLRTVVVIVGDQDSAQELVAEAFARACTSWRTVSRHPAPAAWVLRTALNLNISRWRRRRREVLVPDPGMLADRPAAATAAQDPVDPQIMAALLRLPARQRQVVALRLILDLDTRGTARVLGITPNTVMAHMARALATLRSDLVPEPQQENQPCRASACWTAAGSIIWLLLKVSVSGIPALVKIDTICSSNPALPGPASIGVLAVQIPGVKPADPGPHRVLMPANAVTVINPAAMPAGTELFLGYVNSGPVRTLNARLIYANSYTCSTGVAPGGPAGS